MKINHATVLLLLIFLLGCKHITSEKKELGLDENKMVEKGKPMVSFTFDDGKTSDEAGILFKDWNRMILSHLADENLKAIFFITGENKLTEKGSFLLKSWDQEGHRIGNHSFTHPNFNAENNNVQFFEDELEKTDVIISKFKNSINLFRFPYLKEGQNEAKVDSIRGVLSAHNYANGYVTIDASDWYVDQRLVNKINEVGFEKTDIEKYKDFYIRHILERSNFYENLSYEMNGRHIPHTLLLHHNLVSALFLDDLIKAYKEKGWEVLDAEKAYQDKIFDTIPQSIFAGESLIYSLAKQSGKHEEVMRYPAEDSRYEKEKMQKLGL